jgi:hypothetical protein
MGYQSHLLANADAARLDLLERVTHPPCLIEDRSPSRLALIRAHRDTRSAIGFNLAGVPDAHRNVPFDQREASV